VIPLLVAMWVFVRHRGQFPLVRNIFVLTGLLALVGYELYPLAPPRLTPPVLFDGHLFHFKDTMQHIIGTGKINDTPIGYNPYSAMPSLHFAWALIVALILALMVQNPVIRFLALCYPATMLYAVVVTGNHFLLDAAGAAGAVALAVVLAFGVERGLARARLAHRRRFRATASGR
jgi:membrane-associated phospholipid phosphatase